MPLSPGTRLGPYEVVSLLGAGGMGEVFRARDTRLNRDVAIKVLPAAFAEDKERVARFRREAQLVASLNHPGIAAIHGLEETNGSLSLVLELVDGEDLAQRLSRGPIPVDEALAIARQIAEGLEAAHERGIVHRDLKPANVKLTKDGAVKILDFGLAKLYEGEAAGDSGLTQSPTMSRQMTEAGVILGTAAYMSPEQARGRTVDKRADIWSFGVVLFEMLTGKRLFAGETVSDTLAAVLRQEVDLNELPGDVPPPLRRVLARCLDRDPRRRLRDIGEARIALEAPMEAGGGAIPAAARPGARERVAWSIAALAVLALVAWGWASSRRSAPPARSVRLAFDAPPDAAFDACQADTIAVSPNGKLLVFTGRSPDGKRQLWLRPLDSPEAKPLPGTEDALEPFWSPDSRSIAFGSHGKLKRLDVAGGQPQTLCDAPRLWGGTWGRGGVILFVPDYNTGVSRIPAQGGNGEVLTRVDAARGETSHRDPSFLPDGRHFLVRGGAGVFRQILLGSIDSRELRPLTAGGEVRYAAPGFLLFMRDGAVLAQPFDTRRLELSGEPVTIWAQEGTPPSEGLSVSENGVLVLKRSFAPDYQLVWYDRQGRRLGAVGRPTRTAVTMAPRLSPDGSRLVFQDRGRDEERRGIWVIDLARDTPSRVTSNLGQLPQWSPDGIHLVWTAPVGGTAGIYQKAWNGAGPPELLLAAGEGAGGNTFANDWSPDGRFLLYHTRRPKTRVDIWAVPLFGDRRPRPVLDSEFDEHQAQISPDGHFIVYRSDVSGSYELYVQPFTTEGTVGSERWRVTQGGGTQPRFRGDGKELFYLTDDGRLMAVDVRNAGGSFEHGAAKELFRPRMLPSGAQPNWEYDVTRDGERFLIGTILDGPNATPPSPVVVLDWAAQLAGQR